jgi:2Fe-2S iron-sulfur cluster binding domain
MQEPGSRPVTDADGRRLSTHGDVARGESIEVHVDGRPLSAFTGETVAAALMAAGVRVFRTTARERAPRGLYCGMGVCYDCLVVVDGRTNTRACMTYLRPGMRIETQDGWAAAAVAQAAANSVGAPPANAVAAPAAGNADPVMVPTQPGPDEGGAR